MALLRSRARSQIQKIAEDEAEAAGERLTRKDRVAARQFRRRVWRGEFSTAKEAMAAAKAELGPKAVDWEALAAFLERIIPLILQILALFGI